MHQPLALEQRELYYNQLLEFLGRLYGDDWIKYYGDRG